MPPILADDASECFLERGLLSALDIGAQRVVDQGVIVTAAGTLHHIPEIIQNAGVEADGNVFLAGRILGTGPRYP